MFSVILLVVMFVTTFVTPVEAASTVKAIINNTTGQAVTLYLYGPERYTLDLNLGKNKAELAKGMYRYYYYACGKEFFGQFEVKRVKDTLEVSCTATSSFGTVPTTQLTVNNQTPFSFWLLLEGDAAQRLYVIPGINFFDIPQGTYTYNINLCNKTTKGIVRALKNAPKITFRPCKTVSIKVKNFSGEVAHILITGNVTYTFDVEPGNTTIKIIPGTYRFSWWSTCNSQAFNAEVRGNKGWYWILKC